MSPSSNSTAAAGGATTFTGIHPDIIQSHILKRLDGPTLAATSCASAELLSLCSGDNLWKDICHSTWPSTSDHRVGGAISDFPSGHRSFYSDAFPAPQSHHQSAEAPAQRPLDTPELISAVDIYYDGALVYSKVVVTESRSAWFLSTPFRVELLDKKETVALPLKLEHGEESSCIARAEEGLRVSWILIDPAKRRAVNVASRVAVDAGWHWLSDDIQVRYASIVGGETVSCVVAVSCEGKEGERLRVKEVSMQVEEMEGKVLSGAESLRILGAAMEGGRRRSEAEMERETYQRFLRVKIRRRERKLRRERGLDMVCATTGISIFFAFIIFFFFLSR